MYIACTRDHSITEHGQIKFLVDNICIQVGDRNFRQTIGVLMGFRTDCAPFLVITKLSLAILFRYIAHAH